MQKKYIAIIILMLLVIIFTLQNINPIKIKLWFWEVQGSMALIIALILLIGATTSAVFSIPEMIKQKNKINTLEDTVKTLEKQLGNQKSISSETNSRITSTTQKFEPEGNENI